MINDQTRGLYRKYDVTRLGDVEGKHKDCYYFVLDRVHDRHAIPALRAYAASCREEFPGLSHDLEIEADEMEQRFGGNQ